MSEKDTTYNGWKNYETWAVALWIDNEEWSNERARELALEARREARELLEEHSGCERDGLSSVCSGGKGREHGPVVLREMAPIMADSLREWVEAPPDDGGLLPDLGASLAADLLSAALSEVDWLEMAERFTSDLPADEPETDDQADGAAS
jgi:hypothetical protein